MHCAALAIFYITPSCIFADNVDILLHTPIQSAKVFKSDINTANK